MENQEERKTKKKDNGTISDHFTLHANGEIKPCCGIMKIVVIRFESCPFCNAKMVRSENEIQEGD